MQTRAKPGFAGRARAALLLAATALTVLPLTLPAQGQQSAAGITYNIPAGSLSSALTHWARTSNLKLLASAEVLRDRTTPGLSGTHAPQRALTSLLAGTGLTYVFNGSTVTISGPSTGGATVSGAIALDTIDVSGGGTPADAADLPYKTPGSRSYISSEEIQRFRGTSVGDFLKGIPGVLNGDNRNSGALDVNIRGMQGQGRVPVIIDGALQETTIFRGYAGIAGRTYLDPDLIGHVMIEKGPSTAADATGAIGGIVRMTTLTTQDVLLPGKDYGIRVRGGFNTNSSEPPAVGTKGGLYGAGTYNPAALPSSFGGPLGLDRPDFLEPTGGNGSIAVAKTSENFDFVAAYARRKTGNYHAGTTGGNDPEPIITTLPNGQKRVTFDGLNRYRAGEEVLNTSQDNTSYLAKGTIKLDGGHRLELGYTRYESEYGEMMPSMIIRGPGAYQGHMNTVEVDTFTARYNWKPAGSELINFNINAFKTQVDSRINSSLNFGVISLNRYYNQSDRWGVSIDNASVINGSLGRASVKYGATYSHEEMGFPDGATYNFLTDSLFREGWREETSGFTELQWKPATWLTFDAGLRYTYFHSVGKNPIPKYTNYPDWILTYGPPNERSGDGWSPIASITVEPITGFQIYGKHAFAIRAPSLFESTKGWSTGTEILDLDPERSKSWEVGFNILANNVLFDRDKFRFRASFFDNHVDDYITRVIRADSSAPMVNIDYADLKGFELSASYDAGKVFGSAAWTRYTYTNFCTKPGQVGTQWAPDLCYEGGVPNGFITNQIPPKDSVSLTLGTRLFEERLTVGGRLTYIGKRPTSGLGGDGIFGPTGSLLTNVEWKPYTLFDAFVSYKVSEQLEFDFAVDNLTDVYYMDTLTLGLIPSPGRTFRANMTMKF